jgi:pimeloyl-ACP methyl ester carboxylesterase
MATKLGFGLLQAPAPEMAAHIAEHLFLTPRRVRRPDWERALLAGADEFRIRWGRHRIRVWAWGSGPTVLLVHGWEGRGSQLGAFVRPLVAAGFRVVCFDAPGHGEARRTRISIPEISDVIRLVARKVGGAYAIIAHSMGGAAAAVAATYAGRVGEQLASRYVLVAPPSRLETYTRKFASALAISPSTLSRMQANMEQRLRFSFGDMDGPGIAASRTEPALFVHDEEDKEIAHAHGQAFAEAWPGARLVTTRGLGHRRILRSPEVIEETVRFLGEGRAATEASAGGLVSALERELYCPGER